MRERRRRAGGGYYTIVRPLIRLAQRLPAGQFVSGLRSCQSKQTSSPQAVATKHLSCCVERFDGGILLWMDHHCAAIHRQLTHSHACNASVKSGCTRMWILLFLHVWRGGTSRRVRGCLSFLIASPPYVTLIIRRHVESLPNSVPAVDVMDGGEDALVLFPHNIFLSCCIRKNI